ncbi:HTH-type transcriptional regulator CatM [Pseudoruegeria aquimaris]|uniref:HTH-type transcriptional regulator CatM n=1 Tax=Pseudoruegeria aquimaris TaxID=393663 RepID=A0A1Y5TII4_9RHOB|nr:LysR family transcriptional regulator [Pseudoruegeria aquimaris]SLN61160.1 HTH-type transcriptional regulator CatM [Pseudoruegeria aquimaris]
MSLTHLRTFTEVHRQKSISKAARSLGLTQPAVSAQIAALETQIGKPLFQRHARGVHPTSVADDLAASLGNSLDHAEATLASFKARSAQLSGVVHIAGPAEFMAERISPLLPELLERGLSLRLHPGGKGDIYGALLADEVDLAFTASEPQDARLAAHRIGQERLLAVAAPTLAPRITAKVLPQTPLLAYDQDLPLVRDWLSANELPLPSSPPAVTAPDLRLLRSLACEGAGWTVLPDYLCSGQIAAGTLAEIKPPRTTPHNAFFLVWARAALRHPRIAFARTEILRVLDGAADQSAVAAINARASGRAE